MFEKVLMMVLFFAVTVSIGVYCRRHATNVNDFVLGGRNMGPWLSAFAYGTTYFSGVVFVGYAGQFGWNFGLSVTWIGIGNAIIGSFLAWVVLGRRTRVMTKHLDSATMPDFFGKRYGSNALKIVVSILIFVFLVPYSASVYKGLSQLFVMAFGIDFIYCVIGMAVLTGIYVVLGGYVAVALNDVLQGIVMVFSIISIIFVVLRSRGGLMAAIAELSQIPSETVPELQGAYVSFLGPVPLAMLAVMILTSMGTWGLPQMVHKFYTIKNEKAIQAGTVISTLFALIIAGGSYFLGSFGRLFYTPGADGRVAYDDIVPTMLGSVLPDILIGLVIIMVLSASMSTLSSLVITSSSTFTLDFLKGTIIKDMSNRTQVAIIKGLCVLFVVLSVVIAINPNNLITTLMGLSWGTLAGAFLGPFLYGLFWKRANKAALWASIALSLLINVANLLTGYTAAPIAGAVAILLSLVIVPVVSLITPRQDPAFIESVFSCYDEKIQMSVEHKFHLKENEDNGNGNNAH
ncbi:MAG: sodium:solute symporter family protein [Anaerovoracaceae bacterium]|jgi:SSS family solute:Na+ symporter